MSSCLFARLWPLLLLLLLLHVACSTRLTPLADINSRKLDFKSLHLATRLPPTNKSTTTPTVTQTKTTSTPISTTTTATTTIKTTTTSANTTTTIATTTPVASDEPPPPFITDLKLNQLSFNRNQRRIVIDYLVQSNISSTPSPSAKDILFSIDVRCTSSSAVASSAAWHMLLDGVYTNSSLFNSKIFLSTTTAKSSSSEPWPGALLTCTATIANSLSRLNEHRSDTIWHLLEPDAATLHSLHDQDNSPNQTSKMEVRWSAPAQHSSLFDLIALECELNETSLAHHQHQHHHRHQPHQQSRTLAINHTLFASDDNDNDTRPHGHQSTTIVVSNNNNNDDDDDDDDNGGAWIPGAHYACSLATYRRVRLVVSSPSSRLLSAHSRSPLVAHTLGLAPPTLLEHRLVVNEDERSGGLALVEFLVRPPRGLYDHFSLVVLPSDPSSLMAVFVRNLTRHQVEVASSSSSSSSASASKQQVQVRVVIEGASALSALRAGRAYEVHFAVSRDRRVRSFNSGVVFMRPPLAPVRLSVFALSASQVNLTWSNESDNATRVSYLVAIESTRNDTRSDLLVHGRTWLLVEDLSPSDNYTLSVRTCASRLSALSCDARSPPATVRLNIRRAQRVHGLRVHAQAKQNTIATTTSVELAWRLDTSNVCDIAAFKINYYNQRTAQSRDCFTARPPGADECHPTTQQQQQQSVDECGTSPLECETTTTTTRTLECRYQLSGLAMNTLYKVRVSVVAHNHVFQWHMLDADVLARTAIGLPARDAHTRSLLAHVSHNQNTNQNNTALLQLVESVVSVARASSMLTVVQPSVDESNGRLSAAYLFMLEHNNNNKSNESSTFELASTRDQSYLSQLMLTSSAHECTNHSSHTQHVPCLLRAYESAELPRLATRVVFIGGRRGDQVIASLVSHLVMNETTSDITEDDDELTTSTTSYENISHAQVELRPLVAYQFFYIFKIADDYDGDKDFLLFAAHPSEPMQIASDIEEAAAEASRALDARRATDAAGSSSSSSRDKLAMWLVAILSVLSSVLLVLISLASATLLVRYLKCQRCHKASSAGASAVPGSAQVAQFALGSRCAPSDVNDGIVSKLFGGKTSGAGIGNGGDYFTGIACVGDDGFVAPSEFGREQMTSIWLVKHANGDLILDDEYRNLPDYRDVKTSYASQLLRNECKNRFLDIKAYDDSRVVLDAPSQQTPAPSTNTLSKTTPSAAATTATTKTTNELHKKRARSTTTATTTTTTTTSKAAKRATAEEEAETASVTDIAYRHLKKECVSSSSSGEASSSAATNATNADLAAGVGDKLGSNVEKSTMFTSSSLSSSSTSSSSSASSSSSCHSLHDELEMMPTSCLSSASCGSSSSSHHATATTDYINANFVQGYSHEHKFIATQGPKRETLVDFWHMCWQYRVSAVVMLTKLVEKGVERCTQYWPERLNMAERYGDYEVTWRDQQRCGDYLKRSFDLVHLPTAAAAASANTLGKHLVASTPGSMSMTGKQQQQQRLLKVTQYYYPEWPDKDTPSTDPISILHLIRDVNAAHLAYHYPIVVHCSAGVGRTGTYITLDAMLEKIERESRIDIYGFISRIRARRQYLVQTAKQYAFVHEALYEYCLYGFTDIECQRFASHLKRLREPVTSAGAAAVGSRSRLYDEYDKLASAFAPNQSARQAFAGENKAKNRCLDAICFDENRVKLSTLSGSAYINATRLKGLGLAHGSELIITQDPLVHTQLDFWKMVVEYECNLIVALNSEYEKEKTVYWPTAAEPVRVFQVDELKYVVELAPPHTATSGDDDEPIQSSASFVRREFDVTEHKYSSSSTPKMRVVQFVFGDEWPENHVPADRASFLDFVCHVQRAAASLERCHLVVHAHGGGSNCSVFTALSILVNQLKNDDRVDVCRKVKQLKTQRPHMVQTFEQYEFLYDCLHDYVDMLGFSRRSSLSFQHSANGSSFRASAGTADTLKNATSKSPIKQPRF